MVLEAKRAMAARISSEVFCQGKGFGGLIVRANKIRDGVNERTDAGFPIFRGGSSPAFKRSMHL
jgi:hypothetical protein